ncbi:MAG: epoxyqueuosine reductase QueH [Candidatus Omnitrophota bacterium]
MKLLLHICCGPCLIYPFSRLIEQKFEIEGFYYNPNIYPAQEYNYRQESLKVLSKDLGLTVKFSEFCDSDFNQGIKGKEDTAQRCVICWSMRLRKTALAAKENGFSSFSTTLLVSPYQNHLVIKQLGEKIGQETGVEFYYEDFRLGFKAACLQAKERKLYRQKYCGCQYSIKK